MTVMRLHVEALFTHDADGQMVCVNEPNGAPAPRCFVGMTCEGALVRYRHDLGHDIRRELEAVLGDGSPIDPSRFEDILSRSAPIHRTWAGPVFIFPQQLRTGNGTVLVTESNAHVLRPHLEAWIPDVYVNQPLFALIVDDHAAAVCCSGRRTSMADQAAVETAPLYRGRGYAPQVVSSWAQAVRDMGRVAIYSTSWSNEASRAVARKLALIHFGDDFHIT
jgi:hypothetical protein